MTSLRLSETVRRLVAIAAMLALITAACGDGSSDPDDTTAAAETSAAEAESVAEPEPTDEPAPTPEPEPTAEPEPTPVPEPTDEPAPEPDDSGGAELSEDATASSGDITRDEAIAILEEEIGEEDLPESVSSCIADAVFDAKGSYDLIVEDSVPSDEDGELILGATLECMFAPENLGDVMTAALVEDGYTRDEASCIAGVMAPLFELEQEMTLEQELEGTAAMGDCAEPRGPATGASPPGEDPELDTLWTECSGGSGDACDSLYLQSDLDSVYEQFAETCGGRAVVQVDCVDFIPFLEARG